jgi:hypothetical protein
MARMAISELRNVKPPAGRIRGSESCGEFSGGYFRRYLDPRLQAGFAENNRHMQLDGAPADVQVLGDVAIGLATRDEVSDRRFAWRQEVLRRGLAPGP